ncbi:putative minor capsid protein [Thomasclavelia cocleata]|mgnify:CR=1 FL=1|uniref:putative minor capsid protein n=1 Tax=Thomasclavelia cocleata TaxID=69824 RepID=UPI00242BB6FB|nr:putative minor capsid protein [Thomasclavelia cocleata]
MYRTFRQERGNIRPLPSRILREEAQLLVPNGIDRYQKPSFDIIQLKHVHFQNSNETRKTLDDTEVVLSGIVFYDCKLSTPANINFLSLARNSKKIGHSMKINYNGDEYTVMIVEILKDDLSRPHHYELGLV